MPATHEVLNQPPRREGGDAYGDDVCLQEAVGREGADWAGEELHHIGRSAEAPEWLERGRLANEHRPELRTHDRYGHRVDEVRYHPAYHELMAFSVGQGLHAAPWALGRRGAHVARAAKLLVWSRVDAGHTCPISMTYAVIPSLRQQPDLASQWEPRALSAIYDPSSRPAEEKAGAIFGMAMTEKQGGSDVRANTTAAVRADGGGPGAEYVLTGHKWFCSAPMSDAFLVLAQAPGGLSCLLLPRWRPDGSRNPIRLQRLKDKLGDRSNASGEIELDAASGWLVGEEGQGVRVIIEMVAHTRLDCAVGAAAAMRHGLVEAAWHTAHRAAFGAPLAQQPLMRAVLSDLTLESEAATALALRLAGAFDRADDDEREAALRRLAMPVAKYWLCKRAPVHAAEALECLGGNGYVEESGLPRLYRQAPLNGIWEGSGNVQCLDVLRAMGRSPESVEALLDEVELAAGADRRLDAATMRMRKALTDVDEAGARHLVEALALLLQASLLVRTSPPAVSDAFVATRLGGEGGRAFGTVPRGTDTGAILARAHPSLTG